jgi:hypothetical protein
MVQPYADLMSVGLYFLGPAGLIGLPDLDQGGDISEVDYTLRV